MSAARKSLWSRITESWDYRKTTELIHAGRDDPDPKVQIELEAEIKRLTAPAIGNGPSQLETIYRTKKTYTKRREAILEASLKRLSGQLNALGFTHSYLQVAPSDTACLLAVRAGRTLDERERAPFAHKEIPVRLFWDGLREPPAQVVRPMVAKPVPKPLTKPVEPRASSPLNAPPAGPAKSLKTPEPKPNKIPEMSRPQGILNAKMPAKTPPKAKT